jgi:hypothetical protein
MRPGEEQFLYNDLVRLWESHKERRFPCGGATVEGVFLVTFDEDLFVLVGAFVRHRKLKLRNLRLLSELQNDLRRVLPALTGEAAEHFRGWEELVSRTLLLAELEQERGTT